VISSNLLEGPFTPHRRNNSDENRLMKEVNDERVPPEERKEADKRMIVLAYGKFSFSSRIEHLSREDPQYHHSEPRKEWVVIYHMNIRRPKPEPEEPHSLKMNLRNIDSSCNDEDANDKGEISMKKEERSQNYGNADEV
jgi:hypothetical protein